MSRTIYYVATSIDGFIADSANDLGWLLQFGFEEFQEQYGAFLSGIGALVMGSGTYEWLLREGEPWGYGTLPTWVLTSRELPQTPGADITFADEHVSAVHAAALAAAGDRDVWVIGGGHVAAQFADAGLLDELQLTVMPVLLGSGTPLLPVAATSAPLALVRTRTFASGAIEAVYSLR